MDHDVAAGRARRLVDRRRPHRPAVRATRSSTCSTAGSSRCSRRARDRRRARSASGSRCRRSRSSSRSSASSSGRARVPQRARRRRRRSAVERLGAFAKVLANAYYFDVGLARFVSGPRHRVRRASSATASTATGSTARSTASAPGSRRRGGGLRKLQTGLVRNYALGDRARRGAAARVRHDEGDAVIARSRAAAVARRRRRLPAAHRADRAARGRRGAHAAHADRRPELTACRRLRHQRRDLRARACTC